MGKFGICPRALCEKQNVLPIGMSEQIRTSRVKVYCPKCQDIFVPKKKCPDIDGAYFGCSFPHILLMVPLILLRLMKIFILDLINLVISLEYMDLKFISKKAPNIKTKNK